MVLRSLASALALLAALRLSGEAAAQAVPAGPAERVQNAVEALAQDASEYARMEGVALDEAMRRLQAQEESVAATDRLRDEFADRLAGISIEHRPDYRIVVLLTGDLPVPDRFILAGGMRVPVVFRTGAQATEAQLVAAIEQKREGLGALLPATHGMGVDTRSGEIVLMLRAAHADLEASQALDRRLEEHFEVPVRVRALERPDANLSIEGGARVEGIDPANGRRYACTTGFVVTDGARTGVVTAAHCPDTLTYLSPSGGQTALSFEGQWGARYQDVQLHVTEEAQRPLFYVDTAKTVARPVTSWRNRTSTRVGDMVCRRGETTGYSCSMVELVDYAPPGALCGGPCDPVWVVVTGPACAAGDSGAPVFSGTVAFGIVKGGNYSSSGRCNFYYYMSTDFLPEGWSLLYGRPPATAPREIIAGAP